MTDSLLNGAVAKADQIRPGQEFAQKASWKVPTAQSVRELAIEWLAAREVDAAVRMQLETMWASSTADGADAPVFDVLCRDLRGRRPTGPEAGGSMFATASRDRAARCGLADG